MLLRSCIKSNSICIIHSDGQTGTDGYAGYKTLQQRIRTKKGIRRHGEKKDRIPIGIREIVTIEQLEDYMQFVPYELEGTFTSADFAKAAHIPGDTATQNNA